MQHGNVFSRLCVCLSVCLSVLIHLSKALTGTFFFTLHVHLLASRSSSFIEVIGSRSRSQAQKACLCIPFVGGKLSSTERQPFTSTYTTSTSLIVPTKFYVHWVHLVHFMSLYIFDPFIFVQFQKYTHLPGRLRFVATTCCWHSAHIICITFGMEGWRTNST